MRFVPTKIHGPFDYLIAILMIASPWIFNFAGGTGMWVPVIAGSVVIVYSLLSDYESGMTGLLSMRAHLALDIWAGVFVGSSPWLFMFYQSVYMPHLAIGLVMTAAALITHTRPSKPAGRYHAAGQHAVDPSAHDRS
ncbi:MAG TPA: SPW repeat protein [Chryseosolibacter sp.]